MRDRNRVGYGAADARARSFGQSQILASTTPPRGPLPLSTRAHSDVDVVEREEEHFPRLDTDDESSVDRDATLGNGRRRAFDVGENIFFDDATSRRTSRVGEDVEVPMTRARGFGGAEDADEYGASHLPFTHRASRTHVGAPMIYASSQRRNDRTFERKRRLDDWRHAAPMTGAFGDGENFARWERASVDRCRSLRSARAGSMGGIPNLGNSCYMSSTLQLLRSMKSFVRDVGVAASLEKPTLSALKDFFESDLGELSAAGVKLAMSHVRNEFGEYDQHDAMEFLTVLLETIENEIGDAAACPSRKNFLWRIDHELKCAACGKANTIQETMYALTLQIEPDERESVETLLERFFATESVHRKCDDEACRHETSQSSRRIVSQPKILLLHLKRFSATYERGEMHLHKLSASIRLPRSVSLRLFADESEDRSPGVETPRADSHSPSSTVGTPMNDTYALLSVISHFGSSIQTGHYVCHRREDRSSSWRTFDDERVTPYVARNDDDGARALISAQEFERECYVVAYETTTNDRRRE